MASKKTVSSWRNKLVYSILAPDNFDKQEIGSTISSDPKKLIGRTVNVTLGGLTNERSKNYLNLVFEIYDVKTDKAFTKFKKFFIPVGYLRSKVRKRTKKIDYMGKISVGGKKLRVKVMVLSRHKVSEIQERQIKEQLTEILTEHADETVEKFVHQTLFGKIGTEIYKKIRSVCPILRVEIHQIEIVN